MKKKLAIVTTHPIQYNAPWFKLLAQSESVELKVFYTWSQAQTVVADLEFGRNIQWDIPLTDGYEYVFIENVSNKPKQGFRGIDNPELIPVIERWGADAVMVFGWNYKSHFRVMRHFHGSIPVWFRGDSTLLDERHGLKRLMRHVLLRYVYSYIDKAFYVGTNNRAYFKRFGLKDHQLVFAPHSIDNLRFGARNAKNEGAEWRRKLGYDDNDIVILFAGKFIPQKNLLYLVQCFSEFLKSNQSSCLKLLLAGNGALEDGIKRFGNHSIKIIPFQNQTRMPALYSLCDAFILPSQNETWGLAINEAMAAAKAVVASEKVGCAVDLVKDGENGFYFSLEDCNANLNLFRKIESSHLIQMGIASRQKIQPWCFENIVKAIENEISKL